MLDGVEAVVFDLDDTLYPERSYTFSGYRAVAAAFAEQLGPVEQTVARMQALFDTPDRGRVFDVILSESGLRDGDVSVAAMIETFRAHEPLIELFPDAARAIDHLAGRCRIGIISDGFLIAQSNKVSALNLRQMVNEVILTDELGPDRQFWKPHTQAFEEMARRLDVPHEKCIYIADNAAKDFIAPNKLGWRTAHVLRPNAVYADRQPPEGGAAGHVTDSLDRLLD